MRKRLAILIIGLMLINILSFIKPVQANPAAALMGPGVYYAIAGGLTACGLYAADSESLQYIVDDYWQKQDAYMKEQWKQAVRLGVVTGKIICNANTMRSIYDYVTGTYELGSNSLIVAGEMVEVEMGGMYRSVAGGYYFTYSGNKLYFVWPGGSMAIKQYPSQEALLAEYAGWYLSPHTIYQGQEVVFGHGNYITGQQPVDLLFSIPLAEFAGLMAEGVASAIGYVGDAAGFGTALGPDQEVKVPCPPVPEIDWPDSWIDDLERSMNETGNPSIDDETTIQEGEDDWDWYVDKDTGEIYKRRKGEGPRKDEDKKIGFPVPTKEPDVPDDFPTPDNPDETTIEYPPETEIINNPDGTTTEKTVQHSDTTRKFYDPLTNKWTETTTRTTTTTETTLGPDGLPLGPATVTVTTGPPTTVTTKPPTDDTGIDWQPLKKGATTITRKFPFSLPWDLYNSFKQLDGSSWDGKIDINIDTKLADFIFEIDLGMFDAIRNIVKRIELLIFDVGLILATRRLMGGGV